MSLWVITVCKGKLGVDASNPAGQGVTTAGKQDEKSAGSEFAMSGKKGHRSWGKIKKQPTKQVSYQASFIGPDQRRHYTVFASKMNAEAWLARERDYKERCGINGETWKPPAERKLEKKAEVLRLA
jgi:hypothetical protein